MFFHQLARNPYIGCESANYIARIALNNRSKSFSGDRAVVSDNYRRLSRGESSGGGPHKFRECSKVVRMTSRIRYLRVTVGLQALFENPQPVATQNLLDLLVSKTSLDQFSSEIAGVRMVP